MMVGIIGYGAYIPKFRIKREEYVKAWGSFSPKGVEEKSVMGLDEDAVTMAVEASINALKRAGVEPRQLDGVLFASTSSPYAEKLSSSTIAASLDVRQNIFVADLGFSAKAGTSALIASMDLVSSGRGEFGLGVTSDSQQAMPIDALEHGMGAAAAAFVVGKDSFVAKLESVSSSSIEIIGDRYRRSDQQYLKEAGIGAYADYAFNQAVTISVTGLLKNLGCKAEEFTYAVFQQSDGRSSYDIGRSLGFKDDQIAPSILATRTGDTASSSCLLGLCSVLDVAKPMDRILVASYGAGAGSDALSFLVTDRIENCRNKTPSVQTCLTDKEYIDYVTYLKLKKMLGSRN